MTRLIGARETKTLADLLTPTATQSALGAAGSFAALLVWIYWSSQIFLLGATLAVELSQRPPRATISDPVPVRA